MYLKSYLSCTTPKLSLSDEYNIVFLNHFQIRPISLYATQTRWQTEIFTGDQTALAYQNPLLAPAKRGDDSNMDHIDYYSYPKVTKSHGQTSMVSAQSGRGSSA